MIRQTQIFLSLFCAFFLIACGAAMSAPEEVAVQFTRFANEGKVNEMIGLMAGFENAKPDEISAVRGKLQMMLAASAEETQKKGGIKTVRVNPEKKTTMTDENTAQVSVEILFENGTKTTDELTLIKENGKWKVAR